MCKVKQNNNFSGKDIQDIVKPYTPASALRSALANRLASKLPV